MIQPLQAELSAGPFPLPDFPALHRAHPRLVPFARQLGGTSLREVPGPPGGARILAKCEGENPVGSVKDRVAYALICSALEGHGDRDLSELRLLEYSGGNLARALAHLGALLGIHMKFVVPSVTPPSLLDTLTGYGFEYALVDKELGFLGVIEETLALAAAQPEWTLLYQHRNEVNPAFHAATTGAELLDQLDGVRPAAWVASIGSGGTLTGVRSRLLEVAPGLRTVGVTPPNSRTAARSRPTACPSTPGPPGWATDCTSRSYAGTATRSNTARWPGTRPSTAWSNCTPSAGCGPAAPEPPTGWSPVPSRRNSPPTPSCSPSSPTPAPPRTGTSPAPVARDRRENLACTSS